LDVQIRALEKKDLEDYWEIRTQRKVCENTMGIPYTSKTSMEISFNKAFEDKDRRELAAESNGKVLGFAGLFLLKGRRKHTAEMGIMVNENYFGKGIGTLLMEGLIDLTDNWLNIRRIQLEVYTDNLPAIRLYKKFNFKIEGLIRDLSFRNGKYIDGYLMARIKKEP